jgi:hypothetical protein
MSKKLRAAAASSHRAPETQKARAPKGRAEAGTRL